MVLAEMLARAAMSNSTASEWPCLAAQSSAVIPFLVTQATEGLQRETGETEAPPDDRDAPVSVLYSGSES
jgi:hypothetical protein